MIKVVLFDIGGVVVTTIQYKKHFTGLLERNYGKGGLSFDNIYSRTKLVT